MKRGIAALVFAVSALVSGNAFAQPESAPGPGALEVTLIPAGGTFFSEKGADPSFGNYNVGGTVAYNINRFIGVEAEIGGTLGISQDLQFGGLNSSVKTPNTLNYTGNVVVAAPLRSGLTPYVTGGAGGLTLVKTTDLGITDPTTFFTGNVGGGLKWYANGRWGLRADYRFIAVKSKDDAPAFFGRDTRYANRVYAGFVLNVLR